MRTRKTTLTVGALLTAVLLIPLGAARASEAAVPVPERIAPANDRAATFAPCVLTNEPIEIPDTLPEIVDCVEFAAGIVVELIVLVRDTICNFVWPDPDDPDRPRQCDG